MKPTKLKSMSGGECPAIPQEDEEETIPFLRSSGGVVFGSIKGGRKREEKTKMFCTVCFEKG